MKILTEKSIYKNYKNKKYAKKAIKFLKERHLLPLHPSKELSSLAGHLIGDGTLSKDKFVGDFRFYGTKNKLEDIKKKTSNLFKIQPKHFFERKGGFVLKYNNCIIARVLDLIGIPRGNKVITKFKVPLWIKNGNKNIKRAFLIAICDDELSSPRIDKRGNVEQLRLKFNKTESLLKEGINFLTDIKELFYQFKIECSSIKINNERYINLNNQINRSIYFNISAKKENLIRFKNEINFSSEREKRYKLNYILANH